MKRIIIILFLFSVALNSNAQEHVSKARKYARASAEKIMKEISPNSGKNSDYDLDYESIIFDPYENEIECKVALSWEAKETVLFSYYDVCRVEGKLYIYLNEKDQYGNVKTKFTPKWSNEWAKKCSASHGWNTATVLTFYLLAQ